MLPLSLTCGDGTDDQKLDIRSDGFNNYIPLMTVEPVDSVEHFEELFS